MSTPSARKPPVRVFENYNNAKHVIVPHHASEGDSIRFLGSVSARSHCERKCIKSTVRCFSYVYLKPARGHPGECYSVTTPNWNPAFDPSADSGIIRWPCRNDEECSLNGRCVQGTCDCRAAWHGHRCEKLSLLPPRQGVGYRAIDDGRNTSSWGAAVLLGPDGLHHMWVSEMTGHCGIGTWVHNSRIVHATSASAGGSYVRKDITWPVFAHEPVVVPGPNGEFVMFFTGRPRNGKFSDKHQTGYCDCCRSRGSRCDGSTGPGDCPSDAAKRDPTATDHPPSTYMSWTNDPNGNWSNPRQVFSHYKGGDTNFSPLILANGSLVGLWRRWSWGGGSRVFVATATDWREPATYQMHRYRTLENDKAPSKKRAAKGQTRIRNAELFPDLGPAGAEDQFLYMDSDGNYHAVFHNMVGTDTKDHWWLLATGGHAWSRDGWNWTYTGVAWGNATARSDLPNEQGAFVTYRDGSPAHFTRVERPHLIFAGAALRGDPEWLVSSIQYGGGMSPTPGGSMNDDASFTLIQQVRRHKPMAAARVR